GGEAANVARADLSGLDLVVLGGQSIEVGRKNLRVDGRELHRIGLPGTGQAHQQLAEIESYGQQGPESPVDDDNGVWLVRRQQEILRARVPVSVGLGQRVQHVED